MSEDPKPFTLFGYPVERVDIVPDMDWMNIIETKPAHPDNLYSFVIKRAIPQIVMLLHALDSLMPISVGDIVHIRVELWGIDADYLVTDITSEPLNPRVTLTELGA